MSKITNTLFGGTDDSAQKSQIKANAAAQALIAENAAQARGDILKLIPSADTNRNLGFQAALDVFGQSVPQQLSTFQQGNVGAQQALLAGLPQMRNAILGLPTDLSGLQAQQVQFDPSFASQQLPEFVATDELLPAEEERPILAGRGGMARAFGRSRGAPGRAGSQRGRQ